MKRTGLVVVAAAGAAALVWALRSFFPQWLRVASRALKPLAGVPKAAGQAVPAVGGTAERVGFGSALNFFVSFFFQEKKEKDKKIKKDCIAIRARA